MIYGSGIADLIAQTKIIGKTRIEVIELKKDAITADTLLQVSRYRSDIVDILSWGSLGDAEKLVWATVCGSSISDSVYVSAMALGIGVAVFNHEFSFSNIQMTRKEKARRYELNKRQRISGEFDEMITCHDGEWIDVQPTDTNR